MLLRAPRSPLFPYTTLFRSGTLDLAAGKTLAVNNGTFRYSAGNLTGAGSLSFNSATANFTPNFTADTLGLRSEEHTSELQSLTNLVCRLLLEKNNKVHTSVP